MNIEYSNIGHSLETLGSEDEFRLRDRRRLRRRRQDEVALRQREHGALGVGGEIPGRRRARGRDSEPGIQADDREHHGASGGLGEEASPINRGPEQSLQSVVYRLSPRLEVLSVHPLSLAYVNGS